MRESDNFEDPGVDGRINIKGYRVLVGKHEGKRPLGIPRRRWGANIKMDLQEVGCWGMAWHGSMWLRIGTAGGQL